MTELTETKERSGGFVGLAQVRLSSGHQSLLDRVTRSCGGADRWRHRKLAELREVLALAQVSNRMRIVEADAREALKLIVVMRTPVPCLPDPRGELVIETQACLGISYPETVLVMPLPGVSCVQILGPRTVWHPNCSQPIQALCLGPSLPAGIRLREVLFLSYGALSLQNVGLGERGNGVMNKDAALWWLANQKRMPLSREPFISPAQ